MKISKKGQAFQQLSGAALGVGVFVIIVAIVATILGQVQSTQVVDGLPYNITADGLDGIALFGDWVSIVVIVAIAAVVISLIVVAFRAFT